MDKNHPVHFMCERWVTFSCSVRGRGRERKVRRRIKKRGFALVSPRVALATMMTTTTAAISTVAATAAATTTTTHGLMNHLMRRGDRRRKRPSERKEPPIAGRVTDSLTLPLRDSAFHFTLFKLSLSLSRLLSASL